MAHLWGFHLLKKRHLGLFGKDDQAAGHKTFVRKG